MHANDSKGIPMSLSRWWVKFTYQIHGDKLHGLSSSFEMSFLKLYLCDVVFFTQLTSFTMLLYVSFHTYPIVESSDCCIHPGKAIVSTMIMCHHQYVIYYGSRYYYQFKFITCWFHNSSENAIFYEVYIWW